jgi:hypothetical protein
LLGIFTVLAFLFSDQRASIKSTEDKQDQLYALMQDHVGYTRVVNMTKEGRRMMAAQAFANQVLSKEDGGREKKIVLLQHGIEGIKAYHELRDVASTGIEHFAMSNPLHAFQVFFAENHEFKKSKQSSTPSNTVAEK